MVVEASRDPVGLCSMDIMWGITENILWKLGLDARRRNCEVWHCEKPKRTTDDFVFSLVETVENSWLHISIFVHL